MRRLATNRRLLISNYRSTLAAVSAERWISPAGEWLIDNFHVINEQLREAQKSLPPRYYRQLPQLPSGHYRGLPRAFAVASELVAHTDGHLDIALLDRFLRAYQAVTPLDIGELWAIPSALRHAFLDRLARIAVRVDEARREREAARSLAQVLTLSAARGPEHVAQTLRRRVASRVLPSTTMFATELAQRLRDQDPALALAAEWLEQRISEGGTTLEEAIRAEHRSQAMNQTSVGNVIGSMRTITATDWSKVFEGLSPVEQTLRRDPSGDYTNMDFATRDRYRHVVELIARRTGRGEMVVAETARSLAQATTSSDPRARHVGYYLIDHGVVELGRALGHALGLRDRASSALRAWRTALYLGGVTIGTVVICLALARLAISLGAAPIVGAMLALLATIPVSELTVSVVQLIAVATTKPVPLPKLEFREGLPEALRTLVVVPAMLTSRQAIVDLIEWLEVHFLANQDRALHLALLTDFVDSDRECDPADAELLAATVRGVQRLNQLHGADRFLLLHRRRVWSEDERQWMGWERKRGKLAELNRLILRSGDTTFTTTVGELEKVRGAHYVITLDADTQLPRGTALRMVGAMAHPLNRPRFDPESGLVCGGHAVLQPRVSASLVSARRTAFARLCAHQEGVDPYTHAVSDVYQDLFDEGSFVGKGIYDVRAFEHALRDRIPERAVLSHDLIEGAFARAGLVSDVEVFDETPSHYLADSLRRHRWIRGDWQITRWLGRRIPGTGGPSPNPLPLLARWKIFDNLRRSLAAPTTLALLLLGWLVLGGTLRWTATIGALLFLPVLAHALSAALRVPFDRSWRVWRSGIAGVAGEMTRNALRVGLDIVLLPHDARVSVDAICRALYRMRISHHRLLEWVTAAQTERGVQNGLQANLRTIGPSLLLPLLACGGARVLHGPRAYELTSLIVIWLMAPFIATWLGRPTLLKEDVLSDSEIAFLRRSARKTWLYFERFMTDVDHHLPVDNFQANPAPLIAHRTSPTNIGLSLLASVSALDLGYHSLGSCLDRIERTIATMERLERHRGHLLNWYDTTTLAPLAPRYVSMVDSGNLAAVLISLKQFLLHAAQRPSFGVHVSDGLADALRLADEIAEQVRAPRPIRAQLAELLRQLAEPPDTPEAAAAWLERIGTHLEALRRGLTAGDSASGLVAQWVDVAAAQLADHVAANAAPHDAALLARLRACAARVDDFVEAMDFRFLFHEERQVFAIGYDIHGDRLDGSFYDLLASEARLGSFVAIALGQVPLAHWYKLGRPLAQVGRRRALLSWTGTMFEYLLPSLFMKGYRHTLLDETCRAVVARQITYGRQNDVPWGISECAYNARDLHLNYQYGPFGVPGLGIKRGLADDLVVAPYASALALSIAPRAATANLDRLAQEGLDGELGFYEAIDYTGARVPSGERGAIVYAFMAHHQGMTLLSIAEQLCGRTLRRSFSIDPRVKATELLLQERIPYGVALEERHGADFERPRPPHTVAREEWRDFLRDVEPDVQLLSNGGYSIMVSSAGGGYSRWRDLQVTRWREDPTCDPWGQFHYVRDLQRDQVWSVTPQPRPHALSSAQYCFSLDKAEYRCSEVGIDCHLVVAVATEDDAEVRALTFTNRASTPRELEVTSYVEIVLTAAAADAAHPAFAKLFVETEHLPDHGDALLATRRPRSATEERVWAVHACALVGELCAPPECETDRARFIGRGRGARDPIALRRPLSGCVGPVLDPCLSLRRRVRIPPGKTARLLFTTAVATTRDAAVALASKYSIAEHADRAPALAWTQAQSQLHYLDIGLAQTRLFRRLAAHMLYGNRGLRAKDEIIARNQRGQSALWGYGISGDLPIVLLRVAGEEHVELLREVLHAHEFWRMRGWSVDLVVLNEHPPTYMQAVQDQLLAVVRTGPGAHLLDRPGGVFVRRADLMPEEDRILLQAIAHAILLGSRGSLAEQVNRARPTPPLPTRRPTPRADRALAGPPIGPRALLFDNGTGGFSEDGREYVIRLAPGAATPLPWVNVLANAHFGSLVSEVGSGYDWAENCHENRLTAWSNDPICDPPSSAIYVRDDESGIYWSPTPLPVRSEAHFLVRHGQGYTVFATTLAEIEHELTVLVASTDPVRLCHLTLRNIGKVTRRLTVTGYLEWTLGVLRETAARHVVTSIDDDTGAFLARNSYPGDLGSRVAFVDTRPGFIAYTGDRGEFLGRYGNLARPASLLRSGLSGRAGAAYDPCAAVQVPVVLRPGERRSVVFVLGQAADLVNARALIARYREDGATARELEAVRRRWDEVLGAVEIETPDRGLDLLVNRWLLYQVISSRLWGRTGLYQSGGAFGFRDQLQDVSALLYTQPRLAREHIVRAAARQFVEGDVQHWWHPPSGRGVRTRFADDYLWLPFIAARYVEVTGDAALWDLEVPFIEARPLHEGEQEAYLLPTISDEPAPLWDHCLRAVDRSLGTGTHGLPLMGAGDWNDGMNRVGIGGRGESVWMAWFLIATLERYVALCQLRCDQPRANRYRAHVDALKAAVEREAWDGAWYLRAFFDDGTPLGTSRDEECRIDSIAQSWSVISGAASPGRAAQAIASVEAHLVDREHRLFRLLAPPFDHGTRDPGYIKGYVPGVRENGGHYTHAAAWLALAEAWLGRGDQVGALLHDLNPAHLAADAAGAARYRLEPYVVAGDIYAAPPHTGRGGWSWYTGSAAWIYRVAVESMLGLQVRDETLRVDPCIPHSWSSFRITLRRGGTRWEIRVDNPRRVERGVHRVELDGRPVEGAVALDDDGGAHEVRVILG
jgi:cellobiose phosphorylase